MRTGDLSLLNVWQGSFAAVYISITRKISGINQVSLGFNSTLMRRSCEIWIK